MTAFATPNAPSDGAFDGRHARRHRNRDAVVEAVVDFMAEGDPQPTAAMVAERSGVSLRSVFRYFDDLDSLMLAAIPAFCARYAPLLRLPVVPPGTPLAERIDLVAAQRVAMHGVTGRILAALSGRARANEHIRAELERVRATAVRDLALMFEPELADRTEADRRLTLAALHGATQAESWINLADRHGLGIAAQRAAMRRLVAGALGLTR